MFLFIVNVGFEPIQMRGRHLALRSRTSLPTTLPKLPQGSSNSTDKEYGHHSTLRIGVHMYCATETSPKKEAQIARIKITATYRGSYVFFLYFSMNYVCIFPR